jgi:hypothetical protein
MGKVGLKGNYIYYYWTWCSDKKIIKLVSAKSLIQVAFANKEVLCWTFITYLLRLFNNILFLSAITEFPSFQAHALITDFMWRCMLKLISTARQCGIKHRRSLLKLAMRCILEWNIRRSLFLYIEVGYPWAEYLYIWLMPQRDRKEEGIGYYFKRSVSELYRIVFQQFLFIAQ